jgi:hypothetical protein
MSRRYLTIHGENGTAHSARLEVRVVDGRIQIAIRPRRAPGRKVNLTPTMAALMIEEVGRGLVTVLARRPAVSSG